MKQPNSLPTSLAVALLAFLPTRAHAYEVWMGTLGWERGMRENPEQWSRTAALVEGLNVNWAHGQKDDERLGRQFRDEVVAMFAKAKDHAYQVLPHGKGRVTADNDWTRAFDRGEGGGYRLEYLYTYNGGKGKVWKDGEHELLRQWLDRNGHAGVKIAFNGRSGHGPLERPVVQGNGIECDLTSWKENKGGRHELLRWMADPDNLATRGEKIFIHCHLNFGKGSNEADLKGAWAGARRMVRDIGRDILNTDALRQVFASDRLVFSFFGGNWTTPEISLLPETKGDGEYAESYTGLLLSLIEQRELFEGRSGEFPTDAQCASFARTTSDPLRILLSSTVTGADGKVATREWKVPLSKRAAAPAWTDGKPVPALSIAAALKAAREHLPAGFPRDATLRSIALRTPADSPDGGEFCFYDIAFAAGNGMETHVVVLLDGSVVEPTAP